MTCYKLAKVRFDYWGLQGQIERFIQATALRETLVKGHRQVVCWVDEWWGKSMDDIRKMEVDMEQRLNATMHGPQPPPSSSSPPLSQVAATNV